ncbi:MAG: hypothetical protein JWQ04_1144 [Pedosphaera sp.]|nr:hypothetical protein [Pedosphaera sp.]
MKPVEFDCAQKGWITGVRTLLGSGIEVDLVHFDPEFNNPLCEAIAKAYNFQFTADPGLKSGAFRRISNERAAD